MDRPVWRGGRVAQRQALAPPSPRVAPAPAETPVVVVDYPTFSDPVRAGHGTKNDASVIIGLETYPFLGANVPYAKRDAQAFRDVLVYTRGVPPSACSC